MTIKTAAAALGAFLLSTQAVSAEENAAVELHANILSAVEASGGMVGGGLGLSLSALGPTTRLQGELGLKHLVWATSAFARAGWSAVLNESQRDQDWTLSVPLMLKAATMSATGGCPGDYCDGESNLYLAGEIGLSLQKRQGWGFRILAGGGHTLVSDDDSSGAAFSLELALTHRL